MPAHKYFPDDWITALGGADKLNQLLYSIGQDVNDVRQLDTVLPEVGSPLLFQAFRETKFSDVKVVILGQDPYHDGSFNGLAFGNGRKDEFKKGKISPSLKRILSEVERTEGLASNPNLYSWANQGVLLINTAHTVIEGIAGSHIDLWAPFTNLVISALNTKPFLVWMLWGSKAQAYIPFLNSTHVVLSAGHPSPLNTTHPFYECNCFQDCNTHLKENNYEPILWN